MPVLSDKIDNLAINTIRFLSVDAVQKANSGHPGMPMGCAPIAYVLFAKYMNYNPADPKWINRDRFILSAGHGSMLLYSMLHLTGYDLPLEQIKNFRQWGSITPGHPESVLTPGVETTTGPLGQGFANAVGMAIAEEYLAASFNKKDFKIIDNYIYGICSDGDLMEGVSHEAASLAGHLKLSRLIFFYDNNSITIDGKTSLAFSEDVGKRFEAYGWHIQHIDDGNEIDAIQSAIEKAREDERPSLIITKTHIGYGSPNKQDTAEAHGSPLGEEEVKLAKKNLGWDENAKFYIPTEITDVFKEIKENGAKKQGKWNDLFAKYSAANPEDARALNNFLSGKFDEQWKSKLPSFPDEGKGIATRAASGKVMNEIASFIPQLMGGSADLNPSTNTYLKQYTAFSAENRSGRNIHFGIREHAMGSIMNGMALYGGFIPYGSTFLVFSDYLRPAIRLGAISRVRPVYVFTHDSIGLGEDGPTHQPIEHLAALRAIPKVVVIRPADANETSYAWQAAIEHKESPAILVLTRQAVPVLDQNKYPSAAGVLKGAYILQDSNEPEIILMASGSEVSITLKAAEELSSRGIRARVVSFPSWELFEMQDEAYRESVLPSAVSARVSVEAAVVMGWEKYTGSLGASVGIDRFGHSAPDKIVMEKYGFSAAHIVETAMAVLKKNKELQSAG